MTARDGILKGGLMLSPGAMGPELHAHLLQEETFTVIQGQLIVTIDGREHVLEEGQSATVHKGGVHTFRNGGDWKSLPLLEAGYVLHELRDEYRLAAIPAFVARPLFALLHRIARSTGAASKIADRQAYYAGAVSRT